MLRKIIHIDEEKCTGCGKCAAACHEGAIGMVDGKAKLLREDYCDGLGDCLPACPADAIHFEEREAPAYDAKAVEESKKARRTEGQGCPGRQARTLTAKEADPVPDATAKPVSRLRQWPCQLKLVPVNAPFFADAKLLIAADCTAYAYAGTHEEFMKGRVTLIGCPKLDSVDYSEKLAEIFRRNEIRSVTVLRMEVPCCGGLEFAVKKALQDSGKKIPWRVVTVSCGGELLED
jgi:NAD-dependent dihydropyrimidine dehydrogenase PreA subunit